MNNKDLMNSASDNIRILAASMVEKAKSGHPGGAMGGADFINVKDATAFSSTRDICLRCSTLHLHCKANLPLTN